MSPQLHRAHAPRQAYLSRIRRWFNGLSTIARAHHRLRLERCESRIAPATAVLVGDVLKVNFTSTGATAESVTVSNNGTFITLTGNVPSGTSFHTKNVNRLLVLESGGGSAQTINFSGTTPFSFADGLRIRGIELASINMSISAAGSADISIEAMQTLKIGAKLSTVNGTINLSANMQSPATIGKFNGVEFTSKAVIESVSGPITVRGRAGDVVYNSGIIMSNGTIGLGTTGPVLVEGVGGTVLSGQALITSGSGNVTVTEKSGLEMTSLSKIMAGESGDVSVIAEGVQGGLYMDGFSMIASSGGHVTVTGRGGKGWSGAGYGVGHYGISINTSNGGISASGLGNVTVEGYGGTSHIGDDFGIRLYSYGDNGGIRTSGGNVIVRGFGGGIHTSFTASYGLLAAGGVTTAAIAATGSGSVTVYGKGGRGAGGGNAGATLGGITSVDGPISVIGEGGGDGASGENVGVSISGGMKSIHATGIGNVFVHGTGGATTGNNNRGLTVEGTIISVGGSISVVGKGGGSGASSDNTGVYFEYGREITGGSFGAVDVKGFGGITSGSGNYGINGKEGVLTRIRSSGAAINVTAVSGSTDSEALKNIRMETTGTANITITADSYSGGFNQLITNGTLSIRPFTANTRINLGGADVLGGASPALGISTSEFGSMTAGKLEIGDAATGPIVVSANLTRGFNLILTTGSSITFAASVNFSSGNISLNSAGPIVQTAGTIQTSKGTLTLNAPNQTATFNSIGNKALQLVVPSTVTAIVNGSFDATGFVQVDGTLGGTGSVGVTTVSSTGRIKPGSGPSGKLTTGNIAFNTGSVFEVQINGGSYNQLAVNGTVNLGSATLQATSTGPNLGLPYRIIDNLGGSNVTGTFVTYGEGSTYTSGSNQFRVSYIGGTGNDVTLTPPAVVSTVIFGDGTNQRSMVKQLTVYFSQPVTYAADAFKLSRSGPGGTLGDVGLTLNPAAGPTSSVTITFSGALTEFGSLVDGFYDLAIDAAKVSTDLGNLDGDSNGGTGGNYSVVGTTANKFFRLFGDGDGNGVTNLIDFAAFRAAFNLGASSVYDYGEGDNDVGLIDFAEFRVRFNA